MRRRVTHRRRCQEAARLLRSAVGERPEVWVTTQAWVPVAGELLRPDVAVLVGVPPVDGLLRHPPVLVVDLTGDEAVARRWLAAGVSEVWSVGADGVVRHRPPDTPAAGTGRLDARDGPQAPRAPELSEGSGALDLPGVLDPVGVADLLVRVTR
jgi:hypothetical protein